MIDGKMERNRGVAACRIDSVESRCVNTGVVSGTVPSEGVAGGDSDDRV